jgi:hypothetical protein
MLSIDKYLRAIMLSTHLLTCYCFIIIKSSRIDDNGNIFFILVARLFVKTYLYQILVIKKHVTIFFNMKQTYPSLKTLSHRKYSGLWVYIFHHCLNITVYIFYSWTNYKPSSLKKVLFVCWFNVAPYIYASLTCKNFLRYIYATC